ncbi:MULTISPECIES: hypothetical protein [unclassified Oleiphilus]|uniref:hypothetical protein n=1 Tax=unclassified Oleiphilus TaxID=2631174 RepID=UPI0007C36C3D|nr:MULTISPECIES: hypothetical protein [unclassified Oleiphilus]KZY61596.1 hypothetical protein A3738_13655 [Oleiphilus sp. HI0066]
MSACFGLKHILMTASLTMLSLAVHADRFSARFEIVNSVSLSSIAFDGAESSLNPEDCSPSSSTVNSDFDACDGMFHTNLDLEITQASLFINGEPLPFEYYSQSFNGGVDSGVEEIMLVMQ